MQPPLDALAALKVFHDTGELKHLIAAAPDLENHCFHTYSYSDIFTAALGGDLSYYYQYQRERDSYDGVVRAYYSHAAIDDYYWLAKEYGSLHGLAPKNNPHFKEFQRYLESFLFPDNYCVSWILSTNTRKPKGCGLVFIFDPDYIETEEFMYSLFIIRNRYQEKAKELRRVLAVEASGMDWEQEWKEAA